MFMSRLPPLARSAEVTSIIDSSQFHRIVSVVLTDSQTVLSAAECAVPVHSKVAIFAVVAKVAVAGRLPRFILWNNGEQCERK